MMTYSAATWLLLLPLLILLCWSWWWSDDVDGLVAGFLLFYVSLSLSLYLSISSNCTDSLSSYKCWMINDSDMMWRKEWFDSWCLIPTGEAVGKDALWKSRNYYSKIVCDASLHFEVDYYRHYYDVKVAIEIWFLENEDSPSTTQTASSRHNGARHVSNLSSRHWMTVRSLQSILLIRECIIVWSEIIIIEYVELLYVYDAELRRDETRKFYHTAKNWFYGFQEREREREIMCVYVQSSHPRPRSVYIRNWYRMLLCTVIAWKEEKEM